MRFVPALIIACLALPAVTEAAVMSYSAPASGTESATTNTVPDFDPTLGTLERVRLRLTGTASDHFTGWYKRPRSYEEADGRYSGNSPGNRYTVSEHTAVPIVRVTSLGAEVRGEPVAVFISDWEGSYSGGYSTRIDSTADLPREFFGRSPNGEAEYTLTADSILDYALSPWSSTTRPEFRGSATVIYTYTPTGVSEPASLALLAFGLAGCMAARRRCGRLPPTPDIARERPAART